jgi:hypothetical protein
VERPLLRPVLVAAFAVLLASACGGEQDPAPGRALEMGAPSTYGVTGSAALPPGWNVSLMLTPLRNTSGSDILIRRVEPLGVSVSSEGDAPVDVSSVELAVRDPALAETVPLGFYPGSRPALEVDEACVQQPTVAAEDFVLPPQEDTADDVYLVLRLRTVAPGTFRLDGQRVAYELDGVLYEQDFRDGLEIEVREGADPEIPDDQAACVDR